MGKFRSKQEIRDIYAFDLVTFEISIYVIFWPYDPKLGTKRSPFIGQHFVDCQHDHDLPPAGLTINMDRLLIIINIPAMFRSVGQSDLQLSDKLYDGQTN